MCSMVSARRGRWMGALSLLLAGVLGAFAGAKDSTGGQSVSVVTNVLQLHKLVIHERCARCSLRLEGVVCDADPTAGWLALRDDSGAELLGLEIGLEGVQAGQRVRLEGESCLAILTPVGLTLKQGPLVDNDGIHAVAGKSGTVELEVGRHPIRLTWFNALGKLALEVTYEGPGVARQKVPDAALFRAQKDPASGRTSFVNGLDYRSYEGDWGGQLPDFSQLTSVKAGVTTNFDLGARTREEHVGIEFSGYLAVAQAGRYTFEVASDDGSHLFLGGAPVRLESLGPAEVPVPRPLAIGQTLRPEGERPWAMVEGIVTFASDRNGHLELELSSESERMRVAFVDSLGVSPGLLRRRIRVTGVCETFCAGEGRDIAGGLSVLSGRDLTVLEASADARSHEHILELTNAVEVPVAADRLPLLTTAEEVKRLKREEAQRGHAVRLRGVVTQAVLGNTAAVIQDSTRGIFVSGLAPNGPGAPRVGECWEIEGVTGPGDFAPVVIARRAVRLGMGRLPEPVRATWDQLMNGSLDTQYVELQGIATALERGRMELLLREGKINLMVPLLTEPVPACYQNALVRVRGCLFPAWNRATHRVRVGEMTMANASISIDEPPPSDPFAVPLKHPGELLLFDLRASALQRVKVAGQVLGARDSQYFMVDGTNGWRFFAKEAPGLMAGDVVEAVGFPELVGPSPALREAVARKTAHAPLPEARKLRPDHLLDEVYDATRVAVDGLLVNRHEERGEQVLEMQYGLRTALARLPASDSSLAVPAIGSKLELTGVYVGLGGNRALGRSLDSFELLLNSGADILVLARPPWWTLPRALGAFGVAAVILLGTMLWVFSLRRQVRAQTEIIRGTALRQATLEERTRIAQDIHDELGSSLTRIMLLGERTQEDVGRPAELGVHARKIVTSARSAVQALDEIVWAVNPENDTLEGLAGYLNQYANQFFESTSIRCRLEIPAKLPALVLPADVRHDLFLVVKEALHNVLKHSQASEVRVRVTTTESRVEIAVIDNGCGFNGAGAGDRRQGNGLANMRQRMAVLGGAFHLDSATGQGTSLRFTVTLNG